MLVALAIVLALCPSALCPSQEPEPLPGALRRGSDTVWVIEQAGVRLGECLSHYEGEVTLGSLRAHAFHEQVRLELGAPSGKLEQRFTVDLWTDAVGHPLRFELRTQLGDVKSSVEGVFADGKAELVVHQGSVAKPMSVAVPAGAYLLANNFVSELDLLVGRVELGDSAAFTLFSPNVARALPYALNRVETPDGTEAFDDSLGERLVLADGRLERLEIAAQKLVFRRVAEPVERFTIELPPAAPAAADLEREDVTIVDGPVSLAGTITRKTGASGRQPAVFFLSGSGPQDREGFSGGIDLGTHEILDRLTREGFLVLRVDDRGTGGSTGPLVDLTLADLVEDGRRAVRYLRARPDVDPARVALIGHSEGGVSGPLLASEEPIAALVLMAAPGRPLEALLREQLLAGRKLAGAKPEELERFGHEIDAFLAAIAKGEALDAAKIPPECAAFLPARAWLKSHIGRDPLATLANVRCPTLVCQGGRDVQVSAERDAPKVLAALDAAENTDHELKLFPSLDHLFKKASDPPSELDYVRARPVDAEFLDALATWLRGRLMK
jgi:pimeloyl-ACP methyl ester carboxylesterase